MRAGVVTYAGRVRPGDAVLTDDNEFVVIETIKKAQGRKPRVGENLHLVAGDLVLKFNSTDPVRIRPEDRARIAA